MKPNRTEEMLRSLLHAQAEAVDTESPRPGLTPFVTSADSAPTRSRHRVQLLMAGALAAAALLAVVLGIWQTGRDAATSRVQFATPPTTAVDQDTSTVIATDRCADGADAAATTDAGTCTLTTDALAPDPVTATSAPIVAPAVGPPADGGGTAPNGGNLNDFQAPDTTATPTTVTEPTTTTTPPPPCVESYQLIVTLDIDGLQTSIIGATSAPCTGPVSVRWSVRFDNTRTDFTHVEPLEGWSLGTAVFSVADGASTDFEWCFPGEMKLYAGSYEDGLRVWQTTFAFAPPSTCGPFGGGLRPLP